MARTRKNSYTKIISLTIYSALILGLCGGAAQASANSPLSPLENQTTKIRVSRLLEATSPSGQISGTVTAADTGLPIPYTIVSAYSIAGNLISTSDYSDTDGYYSIGGLETGEYKLLIWPDYLYQQYVDEWYDRQLDIDHATSVPVTDGQVTSGINFTLDIGGVILGTVTSGDDGSPLEDVYADVYSVSNPACANLTSILHNESYCTPAAYGHTDSNGNYSVVGLPAGDYIVGFRKQNFVYIFYDQKTTYASAELVHVVLGETADNVDGILPRGGSITGHVTDADTGLPLVGVSVYGFDSPTAAEVCYDCPSYITYDETDADGKYILGDLTTGNYYLKFQKWGYFNSYYDGHSHLLDANPIAVVTDQSTANIDAELTLGGSISGHVTSTQGDTPLEGIYVYAYDSPTANLSDYVSHSSTNSNGDYILKGLEAGQYYVLFDHFHYRRLFYNDKPTLPTADPVSVVLGQTTGNINASLDTRGIITGMVTDSSGASLPGVDVYPYLWENGSAQSVRIHATTDLAGEYTLYGLDPGEYSFEFYKYGYLLSYYNGKDAIDDADRISVAYNSVTPSINGVLSLGGSMSGMVFDAEAGGPMGNVLVCLYDDLNAERLCEYGNGYTVGWDAIDIAQTNLSGVYKFNGLPTGTYYVEFYPEGLVPTFYSWRSSLSNSDPIHVTAGYTVDHIDAVFNPRKVYLPCISR